MGKRRAPTEPFELPAVPPVVGDWQRARVHDAELEVRWDHPATEGDLDNLEQRTGVIVLQAEGTEVGYDRELGELYLRPDTSLEVALHHGAHHLTDPVFPSHGAEWAASFLALLKASRGDGRAAAYRTAFDRHEVHYSPEHRAVRVHKATRFAPNKEPGCLARVVLDNPPESLLCQLMKRDGDSLLVRDRAGERWLELEHVRYVSYALRSRRPKHRDS